MKKKKIIFFLACIFVLIIFIIANIETTRSIGINHKVTVYNISLYVKILDFYDRHNNYKNLIKSINKNTNNEQDIIINTTRWIKNNIRKISKDDDVIDYHPLTIVERRLGTQDQFSDLLSVLLVYSNIDSFFIPKFGIEWHPLTFFKINNNWSIIDSYYGIYFTNNERLFASIEDIKNEKWEISNLDFEKIGKSNFITIFNSKFDNYEKVKKYYAELFLHLPNSKTIENTNIFDRGGRSYTQNPLGRIKLIIYKMSKKLKI
tara:strand:+ start:62 stop:844 length:783 start_codon:yes stop_codon:yes gene_type:complete